MPRLIIFGDCVSHEIGSSFGHTRAAGLTNWITILSNPLKIENADEIIDKTGYSNFRKRLIKQSIHKTTLDYLFEEEADYLLIDANDCRMRMFAGVDEDIHNLDTVHLIAPQEDFAKDNGAYAELYKAFNASYRIVDPCEYTYDEYEHAIVKICSLIKSKIDVSKIIYNRHWFTDINTDGVNFYTTSRLLSSLNKKAEELLKFVDSIMLRELNGCHIINFPENVFGNRLHIFGAHPFHYWPTFYEYGVKALSIIFKNSPFEKDELELLREHYSLRFEYEKSQIDNSAKIDMLSRKYNNLFEYISEENKINEEIISKIKEAKTFDEYLDLLILYKDRFLILGAVKDSPGPNMSKEILNKIHKLGFKSFKKTAYQMYCGIIKKGKAIKDLSPAKPCLAQACEINISNQFKISLDSQAWNFGNVSSIKINGIEHSLNRRGINIVVVDLDTFEVIDSVAFDAIPKYNIFYRK